MKHRTYLALLFLLLSGIELSATDPVSPVEILVDRFNSGDVVAAREGFRQLVDTQIAFSAETLEKPPKEDYRVVQAAAFLAWTSEILVIWEASEIALQHRGGTTPQQVYGSIEERILRADDLFTQMETYLGRRNWKTPESEASLESSRRSVTGALVRTVAFLRHAVPEHQRRKILQRAVARTGVPETLEELDARTQNVIRLFNIQLERSKQPSPSAETKSSRFRAIEEKDDPQLFSTLRSLYESFLSRDLVTLNALISPELQSPELQHHPDMEDDLRQHAGWRLRSLSRVLVREKTSGEIEVRVEEIKLIAEGGREVRSSSHFTLRRMSDGKYQVIGW